MEPSYKTYKFELLECWIVARKLAVWVYLQTNNFPAKENFGLTSQMRRASISIASNLAEGSSRFSFKEQAHFSTLAYGSTIELLNDLIISNDLGFISKEILGEGRQIIEKITLLIAALRKSQQLKARLPKPLNL
jgi:four helix bundle protein